MSVTRSGIIKNKDVGDFHVREAEDPFASGELRIPRDRISFAQAGRAEPGRMPVRLSGDLMMLSEEPVEVGPQPIERPRPRGAVRVVDDDREPTVEEIEAAWVERLERAREEARIDGIAKGRAEAAAMYESQVMTLRDGFAADLNGIRLAWEAFVRRSEPWILQLAFRVAGALLDAPLPEEVRRVNERVLAGAIENMADGIPLEIVLHPVSFLRLKETGIYEQLASNNRKLRWRTNTEMKQNEWIVQSQRAVTRRLESELIEQLRHELSLLEIHRTEDVTGAARSASAAEDEASREAFDPPAGDLPEDGPRSEHDPDRNNE